MSISELQIAFSVPHVRTGCPQLQLWPDSLCTEAATLDSVSDVVGASARQLGPVTRVNACSDHASYCSCLLELLLICQGAHCGVRLSLWLVWSADQRPH